MLACLVGLLQQMNMERLLYVSLYSYDIQLPLTDIKNHWQAMQNATEKRGEEEALQHWVIIHHLF